MEAAYSSLFMSGVGYALSQDRNKNAYRNVDTEALIKNDMPSMKNIYESRHWEEVKKEEQRKGSESWNNSQVSLKTGVVPRPGYADMFQTIDTNDSKTMKNGNIVKSINGDNIPTSEFTHNNMQPFFRGEVKQNIDPFATSSYLENSTGRGEHFKMKKEVEPLFKPEKCTGNVNGMDSVSDFYMNRIESPITRNNDFPIEQVRVGPGLNQGFNDKGIGGFQQGNTLEYAKPKCVDDLRPLSRPKTSYKIPFQGPQKLQTGGSRGSTGEFSKNRPDTHYEQCKDQWLHTTGAVIRETERPELVVKPTSRVDTHTNYQGVATTTTSKPGKGDSDDYGKSNVLVYSNERDVTQQRTVVSNLTSVVKAVIAPFMDIMKRSTKEYMVDAPRTFGNMNAQIPEKPTTYDPVMHAMKTTIKETTVHDTTIMNPKGRDAVPVQSEDNAKTTNRQTLEKFDTVRNVGSHIYKAFVYDPDVVARNTNRQTTSDNNNQHGYISGDVTGQKGAYSHIEVKVHDTQKQHISNNDYIGHAGSGEHEAQRSYEAEYNAEIDGTREMMNIKSGNTPGAGGAYTGLDSSAVDMETKKLNQDYMAQREEGNISKIYQPTVRKIEQCEVTKTPQGACLVEQTDRLDVGLLDSLKTNPYNLSVNPL